MQYSIQISLFYHTGTHAVKYDKPNLFKFLFLTTVGNKRYNNTRACNRHITVVKRLHLSVLIANCQEDLRY